MKSFVNWLVEAKQKHVNKIGPTKSPEQLNMGDLFGNKLRILITLDGTEDPVYQFIRLFKDITHHQLTLDEIRKGVVTQQIQTQQGVKNRDIAIGTYLAKKKRQDLMNLWSKVKDRSKNLSDDDSSIIISRAPIDLLRMSDHEHEDGTKIQSCHSPNGGWFKCAIQEAKSGGAIAYAVRTQDLNDVKLQAPEIFTDKDRNKNGIVPIERLRLRRFTAKDMELLIPELRTYPASDRQTIKSVPGFHEAVMKWAKEVQESVISKINQEYGDPKRAFTYFNIRGGSYQDNDAGNLWSKFFDVDVLGTKDSLDQSSGTKLDAEAWEEQAREYYRDHSREWEHDNEIDVTWDAQDEDQAEAFGFWNAEVTWNFDQSDFEVLPEVTKDNRAIKGLKEFIASIRLGFDIGRFRIDEDNHYIKIIGELTTEDSIGTLDDFERFLDSLDVLDQNYERVETNIKAFFHLNKLMNSPLVDKVEELKLNHFEVKTKTNMEGNYLVRSEEMPLGRLDSIPKELILSNSGVIRFNWQKMKPIVSKEFKPNSNGFFIEKNGMVFAYIAYVLRYDDPKNELQNIVQINYHFEDLKKELQDWWKSIQQPGVM